MSMLGKGLLVACFFGVVFALYALFQLVFRSESLSELLLGAASLGFVGLLLGGIFAFDGRSEFKVQANAFARIAVGLVAGIGLSLLWGWPGEGYALAALMGGGLGYFGMSWAKYVDV